MNAEGNYRRKRKNAPAMAVVRFAPPRAKRATGDNATRVYVARAPRLLLRYERRQPRHARCRRRVI